jgi:hypothetical protein
VWHHHFSRKEPFDEVPFTRLCATMIAALMAGNAATQRPTSGTGLTQTQVDEVVVSNSRRGTQLRRTPAAICADTFEKIGMGEYGRFSARAAVQSPGQRHLAISVSMHQRRGLQCRLVRGQELHGRAAVRNDSIRDIRRRTALHCNGSYNAVISPECNRMHSALTHIRITLAGSSKRNRL